jgi:hypothetical protein
MMPQNSHYMTETASCAAARCCAATQKKVMALLEVALATIIII